MPEQHPPPKSPSPATHSSASGAKQALGTSQLQSKSLDLRNKGAAAKEGQGDGPSRFAADGQAAVAGICWCLGLLVAKGCCPRLQFWAKKKNSGFTFSGFSLSEGFVAAQVKPVLAGRWKEGRRGSVEEDFLKKTTFGLVLAFVLPFCFPRVNLESVTNLGLS